MLGDITRKQRQPQRSAPLTTRLADSILKGLAENRDGPAPRGGMNFRSSGIPYLCPRLYALAMRNQCVLSPAPSGDLMWTFGVGTAFHTQFQEEFLQNLPKDVFQGWWRNRADGQVTKGEKMLGSLTLQNKWCPRPKGGDYEYVELEFYSKAYRLSGHCDGVLMWPDTEPEIFELKTIGAHRWHYVDPVCGGNPDVGHVAQVQAYMWLSGVRKARIMYVKKDLSAKPRKVLCEHLVEYDEEIVAGIQKVLQECALIVDGPQDGALPARLPECRTKAKAFCKGGAACFAVST